MSLKSVHRASAAVVALYAMLHIANHLAALGGVAAHLAFMDALRMAYRPPVAEALLLACVAVQVVTGTWLSVRGWKVRRGRIARWQQVSGLYLAFFLAIHVSAVLFGRAVFRLDTNFYFAAAGMHVPPFAWIFAPYYFFAVVALFTHAGCALYLKLSVSGTRLAAYAFTTALCAGVMAGALIVLAMAGAFAPVEVPFGYREMYGTR